jgi:hypothetical protein
MDEGWRISSLQHMHGWESGGVCRNGFGCYDTKELARARTLMIGSVHYEAYDTENAPRRLLRSFGLGQRYAELRGARLQTS